MPRGRPKKIIKLENSLFLSIKYGDKIQKQETQSVTEALANISKVFTVKVGKMKLTLEKEGKKSELFVFPFQVKRLLMNKLARELMAKKLNYFLK